MTIRLNLTPEAESKLRDQATAKQLPIDEYVEEIVEAALASTERTGIAALMDQWIEEDTTENPNEIQQRARDLEDLKSALNASHSSSRKLYK